MDMDEVQREVNGTTVSANNGDGVGSGINQLRGWNPSSRIIRVSRASGGKDRHSKVWTSKGLRDRRVRLSVSTAIQFYDLQDRLGYDQPSKAVEWLIKAAADSISELPSINTAFPETPNNNTLQLSDEKMGSNGGNENQQMELEIGQRSQSQALSFSKSACSSTSDTSKNSSGLSLSRSEIRGSNRAKARERAKERATKEKENAAQQNSSSSFTQLLTGNFPDGASPAGYLSQQGYNGQFQLGSSNFPHNHHHQTMSIVPPFSITGENQNQNHQNHHQEALHQFSFVPESLFQPAGSAGEYGTLNFSISGYNRGTLQSNSPSLFSNNVQRIPSSSTNMEGSNIPFFIGSSAGSSFENHHNHNHHQHHQFMTGPDGSLQLYYGDGSSNHKDKGKN